MDHLANIKYVYIISVYGQTSFEHISACFVFKHQMDVVGKNDNSIILKNSIVVELLVMKPYKIPAPSLSFCGWRHKHIYTMRYNMTN